MGSKMEQQDRTSSEANASTKPIGDERKESAEAAVRNSSVVAFKPWGEASGLIFVPDDDVIKIDHDEATTTDKMNASIKAEEFDQSFRLYNIIAHRRVQAAEKQAAQALYSSTNDEEGEEEEVVQVPKVNMEAEQRKAQELSDRELVRALQEERALHRALQEAQLRSSEHSTRAGRSRSRARTGRWNAFDEDPLRASIHNPDDRLVRPRRSVVSPAPGAPMRKSRSNPRLDLNDGDAADVADMDRSRRGDKPRRKKRSGSCPILLDDCSDSSQEDDSPTRAERRSKRGPPRKEGQPGNIFCGRTGRQVTVKDISGDDSDEQEARDKKSRRGPRSKSATRLLNAETTKPMKKCSSSSGLSLGFGKDHETSDRKSTRGPRSKRRNSIAGNLNTDKESAPQNASSNNPKAEKRMPWSSKSFDDTLVSDSTKNSKSARASRTLDGHSSHNKKDKPFKGDQFVATRTTVADITEDDSDDREDRKSRRRLRTSGSAPRLDLEASATVDRKKAQGPSIKRRSSIGSSILKVEKQKPRRNKSFGESDSEQSDSGGNNIAKRKRSSSLGRSNSRRAKDDSSTKISSLEMLPKNSKQDSKDAKASSKMPNKCKSSGALNVLGPLPAKTAKSDLEKRALGVLVKHSMHNKLEAPTVATSQLHKKGQDSKMPRKTISFSTLDSVAPILSRRSNAFADEGESGAQAMRNATWGKPPKQSSSKKLSAKEQSISNFQAMLEQQKATKAKLSSDNPKENTKETMASRLPRKCKSFGATVAVEATLAKLGATETDETDLQSSEAIGLIVNSLSSKAKAPALSNEKKTNVLPLAPASKPAPDLTRLKGICENKKKKLQDEVDKLSASNAVGLIASGWSLSKKNSDLDVDFTSKRNSTSDDAKSLRAKASQVSRAIQGFAAA